MLFVLLACLRYWWLICWTKMAPVSAFLNLFPVGQTILSLDSNRAIPMMPNFCLNKIISRDQEKQNKKQFYFFQFFQCFIKQKCVCKFYWLVTVDLFKSSNKNSKAFLILKKNISISLIAKNVNTNLILIYLLAQKSAYYNFLCKYNAYMHVSFVYFMHFSLQLWFIKFLKIE
jgi:hypothetical protein